MEGKLGDFEETNKRLRNKLDKKNEEFMGLKMAHSRQQLTIKAL
jgi:hypothetical protein